MVEEERNLETLTKPEADKILLSDVKINLAAAAISGAGALAFSFLVQ